MMICYFSNWGYTTGLPSNYDDVYAKAKIGALAAEKVHGNSFLVGSSARILYVASGGSEDWAYVRKFSLNVTQFNNKYNQRVLLEFHTLTAWS